MGTALLEVDGEHVGEVFSIPESKLDGKQWVGVQFARADVVRSALRLLEDGEVWVPGETGVGSVPMCRLDEIGEIGPESTSACRWVRRDGISNGVTRWSKVTIQITAGLWSAKQILIYLH